VTPTPLLFDVESRSRCDLKTVGGRGYWAHPSTEAMCVVFSYAGERVVWTMGDPYPFSCAPELAVAHNAYGFDRHAWRRLGWPEPEQWGDTSVLARKAGLPGSLDALAKRWLGLEKDKEGSRYTLSLSRPSRAKARLGQLPPIDMARVVRYCTNDVVVLEHGWPLLEPWFEVERDIECVSLAIEDRGIAFDVELARALLDADARLAREALGTRDATSIRAPLQFTALVNDRLAQLGDPHRIGDATKASVETLLTHPDPFIQELVHARQALASIARGKLEAGLARVSPDGRLRDNARYIGAHTWRYSGSGMQLQNMPRPTGAPAKWKDAEIEARATARHATTREEIDVLLRACLHAPPGMVLVVADYSSVEARGNAWAADDLEAVDVFRSPDADVYLRFAAHVGLGEYVDLLARKKAEDPSIKAPRQYGKICELALGYGMGAVKFTATAAVAKVKWHACKGDPCTDPLCGVIVPHGPRGEPATHGAITTVAMWRELHAPIKCFWDELEYAAKTAVYGGHAKAGPFEFGRVGEDVWVMMPSGRPLVYPRMGLVKDGKGREQLTYEGRFREFTYGGKLCENVIQAFCRDLLAHALVACEEAGLEVVLHVHDEIVAQVPERLAHEGLRALEECMTTLPPWAAGFPAGAEGFFAKRYRK
jgi:DNA polymerase